MRRTGTRSFADQEIAVRPRGTEAAGYVVSAVSYVLPAVPRLSSFYGIAIYMYVRDHGVAHFHARYGDNEAVVNAATGTVLRGGLPPRQTRFVQEWANIHREELLDAWSRASNGEPPATIEPLP